MIDKKPDPYCRTCTRCLQCPYHFKPMPKDEIKKGEYLPSLAKFARILHVEDYVWGHRPCETDAMNGLLYLYGLLTETRIPYEPLDIVFYMGKSCQLEFGEKYMVKGSYYYLHNNVAVECWGDPLENVVNRNERILNSFYQYSLEGIGDRGGGFAWVSHSELMPLYLHEGMNATRENNHE